MAKAAIIMYGYPLGVSTMIINTAKLLNKRGYDVDIFIDEISFAESPIDFIEDGIHVRTLLPPVYESWFKRTIKRVLRILRRALFFSLIDFASKLHVKPMLRFFSRKSTIKLMVPRLIVFCNAVKKNINREHELIIGVEPYGLFAATYSREAADQAIVYYNMELIQLKSCKTFDQYMNKLLEQVALDSGTDAIVIQNEARKNTFLKENSHVDDKKIFILPVATYGPKHTSKSNYFYEMFKIPQNKKIILYAGNLISWAMCLEIVESVKDWPEDFVLVMHTWNKGTRRSGYFRKIAARATEGRVYFSFDPVNYDDLDHVLSSADAGLLFYRKLDENFTEIEFSSNKLAQYMKVGLPVIACDLPGLVNIIETSKCGVCVSHPKHIGQAISKIFSDYSLYRTNVFDYYENNLDFSKHFDSFYHNLQMFWQSRSGSDIISGKGQTHHDREDPS